ncbi:phosphoglycerate dehydrogenase [Candidatus Planktophila dulcis]|uniref:phosphoglycerate dehydrogenase n=1 Tax=Candidatus Planktophila dulcis TaxID=1884914 RepID=UPI003CFAAAE4
MLNRNSVVAVTSRSFSANTELRNRLLSSFPNSKFNESGKILSSENLVDFLTGAEAGIFALEKIDSAVLSKLPQLKILSKFGVGVDGVDFQALKTHNVKFLHFPGTNSNAVAEIALSNAISLLRRIPENQRNFSNGEWGQLKGREIHGKTVGVIGAGPIGKRFLELCSFFDCELRAFDLQQDEVFNKKFGIKASSLGEVLALSDVVSIHLPLTSQTKGMISADEISLIKSTSVIMNLSRGGILDEAALIEAHRKGLLAGFALDVFDKEPCDLTPFIDLPNVILTPHIGGSTVEAITNMGNAAITGLTNLLK